MTEAKQLVTVKEYTEMRGLGAVQVVNGWIRKQGAPCIDEPGKARMIDVAEMDAWVAEKNQRKSEGKGTTKAVSAQRKTGVRKGTLLAYNNSAGKGITVAVVSKISEYLAWADTSRKKGFLNAIPFRWEGLVKKIKEGELAVMNPHIVIDLLIAHFETNADKHEAELDLLMQLKLLCDPSAGEDAFTEFEASETTEETEDDADVDDEATA